MVDPGQAGATLTATGPAALTNAAGPGSERSRSCAADGFLVHGQFVMQSRGRLVRALSEATMRRNSFEDSADSTVAAGFGREQKGISSETDCHDHSE
jgi:hypothetical protein